jgi:hypothetical protein
MNTEKESFSWKLITLGVALLTLLATSGFLTYQWGRDTCRGEVEGLRFAKENALPELYQSLRDAAETAHKGLASLRAQTELEDEVKALRAQAEEAERLKEQAVASAEQSKAELARLSETLESLGVSRLPFTMREDETREFLGSRLILHLKHCSVGRGRFALNSEDRMLDAGHYLKGSVNGATYRLLLTKCDNSYDLQNSATADFVLYFDVPASEGYKAE